MGTENPASDFPHNVLLIEDNPGDARLICEMLAERPEAPFQLHFAERLAHGLELLSKGCEAGGGTGLPALVLLDLSLPDSFGLDTFAKVYAHSPQIPIIVLTGNDDQTVALSAVKGGAQDYWSRAASTRSCCCAPCSTRSSASATRFSSSIRPTTTHLPAFPTATCCTTACVRRCTASAALARWRWCSSTSITSSSSTTRSAMASATSCCAAWPSA